MGGAEDEALEQWNELLAEEHMEARWQGGKDDEDVDDEDHMVLKIMFIFWLVVWIMVFMIFHSVGNSNPN